MKLREFQRELGKKGIDVAFFFNLGLEKKDKNLFYFTQLDLDVACLLIFKKGKPLLVVSEKINNKKFKIKFLPKKKRLFESVKSFLKNRKIKKIGINKNFISVNDLKLIKKYFKNKKFADVSGICSNLRECKTEEEIRLIKRACSISSGIISRAIKNIKSFKTDLDAVNFLKNEADKLGCDLAFLPIVTQNFRKIHPKASKRRLKKGFLIIDFGVKYKGYCADISRTVYVGNPSEKERKIYNLLLNSQEKTIMELKASRNIEEIARKTRKELGIYNRYFIHGLGHGIGIEIHESPSLSSKNRLKQGMVFTIEPGIYFKNIGVRIEDDVLLEKGGISVLTKNLNKNLVAIK